MGELKSATKIEGSQQQFNLNPREEEDEGENGCYSTGLGIQGRIQSEEDAGLLDELAAVGAEGGLGGLVDAVAAGRRVPELLRRRVERVDRSVRHPSSLPPRASARQGCSAPAAGDGEGGVRVRQVTARRLRRGGVRLDLL